MFPKNNALLFSQECLIDNDPVLRMNSPDGALKRYQLVDRDFFHEPLRFEPIANGMGRLDIPRSQNSTAARTRDYMISCINQWMVVVSNRR